MFKMDEHMGRTILENFGVSSVSHVQNMEKIVHTSPSVLRGIESGGLHFITVPNNRDNEFIDHNLLSSDYIAHLPNGFIVDFIPNSEGSEQSTSNIAETSVPNSTLTSNLQFTSNQNVIDEQDSKLSTYLQIMNKSYPTMRLSNNETQVMIQTSKDDVCGVSPQITSKKHVSQHNAIVDENGFLTMEDTTLRQSLQIHESQIRLYQEPNPNPPLPPLTPIRRLTPQVNSNKKIPNLDTSTCAQIDYITAEELQEVYSQRLKQGFKQTVHIGESDLQSSSSHFQTQNPPAQPSTRMLAKKSLPHKKRITKKLKTVERPLDTSHDILQQHPQSAQSPTHHFQKICGQSQYQTESSFDPNQVQTPQQSNQQTLIVQQYQLSNEVLAASHPNNIHKAQQHQSEPLKQTISSPQHLILLQNHRETVIIPDVQDQQFQLEKLQNSRQSNLPVFACQICDQMCESQLDFFTHLKDHYEPSNTVSVIGATSNRMDNNSQKLWIKPEKELERYELQIQMKKATPQEDPELTLTAVTAENTQGKQAKEQQDESLVESEAVASNADVEFSDTEDMLEGIRGVVDKVQAVVDNDSNDGLSVIQPKSPWYSNNNAQNSGNLVPHSCSTYKVDSHDCSSSHHQNLTESCIVSNQSLSFYIKAEEQNQEGNSSNTGHLECSPTSENDLRKTDLAKAEINSLTSVAQSNNFAERTDRPPMELITTAEKTDQTDQAEKDTTCLPVQGQVDSDNDRSHDGDNSADSQYNGDDDSVYAAGTDLDEQQLSSSENEHLLREGEMRSELKKFSDHSSYGKGKRGRPRGRKNSMKVDNKIKGKKQTYICKRCEKIFNSSNALKYHDLSHTGERPYSCDTCGKSFFAQSALKVHKRLHSGEKPYVCDLCSRPFRQWGDLKYHAMSMHSTEKLFQCEYCGKSFSRKYSLVIHRRIHTSERNYQCEFCPKSFRAGSYLQNHRKIHTGEKPYTCKVCGKAFRVSGDLKRHERIHTRPKKNREAMVSKASSRDNNQHKLKGSYQATYKEIETTPDDLNQIKQTERAISISTAAEIKVTTESGTEDPDPISELSEIKTEETHVKNNALIYSDAQIDIFRAAEVTQINRTISTDTHINSPLESLEKSKTPEIKNFKRRILQRQKIDCIENSQTSNHIISSTIDNTVLLGNNNQTNTLIKSEDTSGAPIPELGKFLQKGGSNLVYFW